jgi:redox-sensitive bicupin YhaK (pirin superfamily)
LNQTQGHSGSRLPASAAAITQKIGSGFTAQHFSEEMFGGGMDPLLMVDHFVMTEPTFEPHLHAGISAVTMMFEDAEGEFLNRDTLGNKIELKAGDLYWLAAACGAVHEERPAPGARIHALQIFVNLPAHLKREPARSLHVRATDVPIVHGHGHRVRVILGRSGDVSGVDGTPEAMTMLDGFIDAGAHFSHRLPDGHQAWIYAVSGEMSVGSEGVLRVLDPGFALSVAAAAATEVELKASKTSHFVLMAAKPIRERFVKHGPLVMSSAADVERTLADYANGRFGRLPPE